MFIDCEVQFEAIELQIDETFEYFFSVLTGNVNLWEPNLREMMKKMYSETYFKSTGVKYLKTCTELFKENSPKIPKDILPNIVCPTLIVHGALDPIVFKQHADFLHQRIANSEYVLFTFINYNYY